MKNSKEYNIFDTWVLLIMIAWMVYLPIGFITGQAIEGKQNLAYATEIAEEYIKEIETEGQLTEQSKVNIINELEGTFSEIKIEYTEQKVSPGENVYLSINVINKNILGGEIYSNNITVEGVAL